MKKILTTLAVSGLTMVAFAQGTVNWFGVAGSFIGSTNSTVYSSFSPTKAGQATAGDALVQGTGNTAGNTTTLYYYELLVSSTAVSAPTTLTSLSSWSDTGLEAQNGAGSNGRILQLNASQNATANNWAVGSTMNIDLVGWSANLGTTYSAFLTSLQNWATTPIVNAFVGASSMGTMTIQNANPGITVFGGGAGNINNQSGNAMVMEPLATVPEPGTMALAALGGASMLLFRRKK
jgi:hypothetical protein